ncbi:MAG TPA: hypothetical protein VGA13_12875 [Acidimicrobiales bacterium]
MSQSITSRLPARLVMVLMVVGLIAAACGSDDDSGTGSVATDGSPQSWVDAVCGAGIQLAANLEPVADRLAEEFADIDPTDFSSFDELFTILFSVLGEFEEPFTDFAENVKSFGPPDVEGGQELYDGMVAGFDAAVTAFATLAATDPSDGLAALTEDDPFAGLESLENLDFADGPPELTAAAEASETCRDAERAFDEFSAKLENLGPAL